jgi:hypothetical protein
MQKHGHSFASGLWAGLIAATITTIANPATLAADSCLASPDLRANQGGHWYYRYDRVNHRRCWYQASQLETRSAVPAATTAAANSPSQPGLASVLSSIAAQFGGTGATGVPQDGTGRDSARATTETPFKRRSRAAPRIDPDSNTKRVQARDEADTRDAADAREAVDAVDPRDANVKRVETITIRSPSPVAPAASAAEPAVAQAPSPPPQWSQASESPPPLDAIKREVLFQEFLRWQERRSKPFW